MIPAVGEVVHFSEDPTITEFVPHVARTSTDPTPHVWACDAESAPSYWFPHDCPRATAWVGPDTTAADRDRLLGGAQRLHAVETRWVDTIGRTVLYAYRLPAATFSRLGYHAWISNSTVVPLGPPVLVGDLVACHAAGGIELRTLPSLWPFWDAVVASTLRFSGIRLAGAEPRAPA